MCPFPTPFPPSFPWACVHKPVRKTAAENGYFHVTRLGSQSLSPQPDNPGTLSYPQNLQFHTNPQALRRAFLLSRESTANYYRPALNPLLGAHIFLHWHFEFLACCLVWMFSSVSQLLLSKNMLFTWKKTSSWKKKNPTIYFTIYKFIALNKVLFTFHLFLNFPFDWTLSVRLRKY